MTPYRFFGRTAVAHHARQAWTRQRIPDVWVKTRFLGRESDAYAPQLCSSMMLPSGSVT